MGDSQPFDALASEQTGRKQAEEYTANRMNEQFNLQFTQFKNLMERTAELEKRVEELESLVIRLGENLHYA